MQQQQDMAAAALALQAELGRRGADQGDSRIGLDRDQFGAAQNQFSQKLAEDQRQFNTGDANADAALAQRALEFQQAQAQQGQQFGADLGLREKGVAIQGRGADLAERSQTFQEGDVPKGREFQKGMQGDQIAATKALQESAQRDRRSEADAKARADMLALMPGSPQEQAQVRAEGRQSGAKKVEQERMIGAGAADTDKRIASALAQDAIRVSVELAKAAIQSNDTKQSHAMALASQAAPQVAKVVSMIKSDPAEKQKFMDWAKASKRQTGDPTGKMFKEAITDYAVAYLNYDQTVAALLKAFQ
jgi:hypothetical protein